MEMRSMKSKAIEVCCKICGRGFQAKVYNASLCSKECKMENDRRSTREYTIRHREKVNARAMDRYHEKAADPAFREILRARGRKAYHKQAQKWCEASRRRESLARAALRAVREMGIQI